MNNKNILSENYSPYYRWPFILRHAFKITFSEEDSCSVGFYGMKCTISLSLFTIQKRAGTREGSVRWLVLASLPECQWYLLNWLLVRMASLCLQIGPYLRLHLPLWCLHSPIALYLQTNFFFFLTQVSSMYNCGY